MNEPTPGQETAREQKRPASERYSFSQWVMMVTLCFGAYTLGEGIGMQKKGDCPIAVAEQSALVLDAALDRQGMPKEVLEREISQPVLAVLKKYADLGYLVVDVSKDDHGNMSVTALPSNKQIDITGEMRDAIKRAAGRPESPKR